MVTASSGRKASSRTSGLQTMPPSASSWATSAWNSAIRRSCPADRDGVAGLASGNHDEGVIEMAKPAKKSTTKKPTAKKAPSGAATPAPTGPEPHLAREQLPIPDAKHVGLTTYDAKDPNTKYPPIKELRPPEGAPNVLIVLIDDVGFGASSAFGGPCNTPVAERLAVNGLKLNRFHTTALCSPTRQAMLTGRNHHSVGMGAITEMATSAPGNNSIRPKEKAPVAETLRLNGYSTAQFGKCHEVPVWEVSPVGPFHQWPTGSGFEYFYGFIGGEANQYYPGLYEG